MATCVHDGHFQTINANLPDSRCIGEAGAFLNGQTVHIGTHEHHGAFAVFQHTHDASLADLLGHHHAGYRAQFLRHARASLIFAERQFRIAAKSHRLASDLSSLL
jgi:hypothetical protein